jgi:hypothetical protein
VLRGRIQGFNPNGLAFCWSVLIVVDITLSDGGRTVLERPWHEGDLPLNDLGNATVDNKEIILPP